MNKDRIAIFIDAENLVGWIKNDGVSNLLEDLNNLGQIIVRKAYGKWTSPQLTGLQETLNRNGFELIHSYHPVSGKNSTDIQMTVDSMECSLKISDIQWIVLATGDSDFSPLFRKLREIGKEVIGVGPKSPLSECVKTSCSRYIYIDQNPQHEKIEMIYAEKEEIIEALELILSNEDGMMNLSILKNRLLQTDSAFNEKRLGYKNFTDFLESIDIVKLEKDIDGVIKAVYSPNTMNSESDPKTLYRKILRNKQCDYVPKFMIKKIHAAAAEYGLMPKKELIEKLLEKNIEGTTSSIINKTLGLFFKAKLVEISPNSSSEKSWRVINSNELMKCIDTTLLVRLISGLNDINEKINPEIVTQIVYGKYTDDELGKLIQNAVAQNYNQQKNT